MSEKDCESPRMTNEEAIKYLSLFMGKPILITTTDERRFCGTMKCTDRVSRVSEMTTSHLVALLPKLTHCRGPQHHSKHDSRVPGAVSSGCGGGSEEGGDGGRRKVQIADD